MNTSLCSCRFMLWRTDLWMKISSHIMRAEQTVSVLKHSHLWSATGHFNPSLVLFYCIFWWYYIILNCQVDYFCLFFCLLFFFLISQEYWSWNCSFIVEGSCLILCSCESYCHNWLIWRTSGACLNNLETFLHGNLEWLKSQNNSC